MREQMPPLNTLARAQSVPLSAWYEAPWFRTQTPRFGYPWGRQEHTLNGQFPAGQATWTGANNNGDVSRGTHWNPTRATSGTDDYALLQGEALSVLWGRSRQQFDPSRPSEPGVIMDLGPEGSGLSADIPRPNPGFRGMPGVRWYEYQPMDMFDASNMFGYVERQAKNQRRDAV